MSNFLSKVSHFFIKIKFIYKKGIEGLFRDPLTNLYNRVLLKEYAEREIRRAGRYASDLYFIMIDIDGLKAINDGEGGHPAGDRALKKIAGILEKNCRKTDLLFRIGGDEFLLLMPETFKRGANMFLSRVKKELEGSGLSVSMGFSFWIENFSLEELIKIADENLYKNKKKKPGIM